MATLQHGGQYGVCAQGQYSFPNDSLFFPDGPNSCSMGTMLGRRAYTTIDRSKPTAALHARGRRGVRQGHEGPAADRLRRRRRRPVPRQLPLLPGRRRAAATCATRTPGAIYGYNAACSVPGSAGKATTFTCTADYGQVPDGNVWACVIAADASIPDNPNGPDQSATAEKANLSDAQLRRRGGRPHAADGRDRRGLGVGQGRRARVARRRRPRTPRRAWPAPASGRGATTPAAASGDAVTHTYTQPGTYEVALTVTDAAGNAATAKKTITVAAAGGGTTTPPARRRHDHAAADGAAARPRRRHGGGDHAARRRHAARSATSRAPTAPTLELDAPRSARARAKSIPVELTASDAGRVQLALARGDARGRPRQRQARRRRHRRLPPQAPQGHQGRPLHAEGDLRGGHRVRASLTLTGKASARRASASSIPGVEVGAGPRALPDGRFHGARPARTFKVR